jgi:hypothetical protein
MQKLKPENRLLLMWRLGVPCLTSPSPAYQRVADAAGVDILCESSEIWLSKLEELIHNPNHALQEVLRGQNYLSKMHTRQILLNKWDQVFESVL